jgi:DNA processing protein
VEALTPIPSHRPMLPPRPVLEAMVRALATPGLGPAALRRAVAGDAGRPAAVAALRRAVEEAERVAGHGGRLRARGWAETALRTIDRGRVHVLVPGMDRFPRSFRNLPDPPPAVFAAGRPELFEGPRVAIVGTRSCTERGLRAAERIAAGVAGAGVTVVSGLALGIDGAAHRAAGPSRTIAILGCGLDVAYPPRHRALQRSIGREGLLLTEHLPGTPPAPYHFPRRNRLIAAIARLVVVVEAPRKSGALTTVRHALELGKPVAVVPGSRANPACAGSNELIEDGATMVSTPAEVLELLNIPSPVGVGGNEPPADLRGVSLALWSALGPTPRHVDEVAAELGLDTRHTLPSLLALEIQGHARQRPGLRFERR